jgi:hypothetical protein
MTWTLGVLIAGSLHWDLLAHRFAWRKARLQAQTDVSVGAPIRYGRRSSSRGDTYTMVFASGTPLGKAKVRRCSRTCLGIDEIVSEAEALWLAESPDGSARKRSERLGAGWGCVTLLPNPHSVVPLTLLDAWAERVERNPAYDHRQFSVLGAPAIDERGILQIDWPNSLDTGKAIEGVDILLATVTRPTPDPATGGFPSAAELARAWNEAGNASYFRQNRKSGIHTFQDEEIEALLHV